MITHWAKTDSGTLAPADEETVEWLKKKGCGEIVKGEFVTPRNYKYLQKFMCLCKAIHDALPEPTPVRYNGFIITPEHTMDNTRKFLTVQAGHYRVIGLPNGKVRVEPKSIAFASMEEEEFQQLYSDVIDAALKNLPKEWTKEELDRVANEIISYS